MSKFANQVPSHTPVKKEAYDLKVENMHDVAKIFETLDLIGIETNLTSAS